jgi:hypothetical protein
LFLYYIENILTFSEFLEFAVNIHIGGI